MSKKKLVGIALVIGFLIMFSVASANATITISAERFSSVALL